MELAAAQGFDVRVVALPPGVDPADSPASFEERLARRRELPRLPRAAGDRARARPAGGVRTGARGARRASRTRRSGRTRYGWPPTGSTCRRRRRPASRRTAGGRATGEISPRLLEKGSRLERDALAGVAAHPGLRELLGRARAGALRRGAAPASASTCSSRGAAGRRARAAAGRARCAGCDRGDRRRDRQGTASAPARAPGPARARRRPTSSGRKSSRSNSRRSARPPRTWPKAARGARAAVSTALVDVQVDSE